VFSALTNLVWFIVAISILVAIHEYGHFIVGRWTGMKVLRFSIGFGKPIWTRVGRKDGTEFCISAIPLGGYVKFLDGRDGLVEPEDEGRAFDHRPIASRIAVLLAGPLFNFIFAVVAYWALFMNGVPTLTPAVGEVVPDSYAAQAGLEFGDQIVAVGDVQVVDWESALVTMIDHMVASERIPMTLKSADGRQRSATMSVGDDATRLTEPGLLFDGLGFMPLRLQAVIDKFPAVVGALVDGGAAKAAGLAIGDEITGIDGERIENHGDLTRIVSAIPNKPVTVEYVRDGVRASVELTIGLDASGEQTRGLLGIQSSGDLSEYYSLRKYGPIESVSAAMARTWTSTIFTIRMLGRMVTGDVSIKNISGPINIAQFAGASAQRGVGDFLGFLAVISISLGVLNLLPVPVLDGGQIVYQSIEAVKGSPMSEKSQLVGQQIGIFALILLMSFAFYNDISRIIG
jgi:regulator of sigma E protease